MPVAFRLAVPLTRHWAGQDTDTADSGDPADPAQGAGLLAAGAGMSAAG